MKKFKLLLFLLICVFIVCNAQMTLENVYSVSANIIQLEKSGFKYYSMDVPNKQSRIYNMDHSIFKIFNLTVPEGYYLYNIQFVSEYLFNSDDLIELVYTYSKYNETETGYWWYDYETRIVNENGIELLKVPGAGFTDVLEAGDNGRKFLVWVYDYSVFPAIIHTNVYDLPDQITSSKALTEYSPTIGIGNPYPNPSKGFFSIPVHLPDPNTQGILNLYDIKGKLVKSLPVSGSSEIIEIPSGVLMPGTYMLNLNTGSEQPVTKKVIIN